MGAIRNFLVFLSFIMSVSVMAAESSSSSPPPEWTEIQNRLQTLKAKIVAKEKTVRSLIEAKGQNKDHKSFETLKSEHAELLKLAEEYEQVRNVLRYRFPEKGMKEARRYRRIEVKSLGEMEQQVGLEGRLQSSLQKVRRQYTGSMDAQAQSHPESGRKPASEKANSTEEKVLNPAVMSK